MAIPQRFVKTLEFLAAIGPRHFIRAIWPTKGPLADVTPPEGRTVDLPYTVPTIALMEGIERLNWLGYSIYYMANDPHGASGKLADIQSLRVIYQDADEPNTAADEVLPCGRVARFTIETSPGKFQRIWLADDLPRAWQQQIHGCMVEWYNHDRGAPGAQRLLRLPGFANTKYAECPECRIVAESPDTSRITRAEVAMHFGIREGDVALAPNINRGMNRIQGSGERPSPTTHRVEVAYPQHGARDLAARNKAERADAGQVVNPVATADMLRLLARVDPDCGYTDWLRVGAALHFMSRNNEFFPGLQLFDSWSALGSKYSPRGPNAPAALWSRFRDDVEHPASMQTLSTLAERGFSPAAKARLESPLFRRFVREQPAEVGVQVLSVMWPETRTDQDGRPQADSGSIYNARMALASLHLEPVYDEFSQVVRLGPSRPPFSEGALSDVWRHMQEQRCRMDKRLLRDFIMADSRLRTVNPLTEWLEALPAWDGIERLATVFQRHLGTPDARYVRELSVLLFCAVIKRAQSPGYKFDLMPVLEGKQGRGKSSLFKHITPKSDWYSEAPRLDLEEKRLYPMLAGKMFVEFAEMRGKKTVEIEHIKAIVSQTHDEFIANYATDKTTHARTAVFIGTTNSKRFLRDTTGNRRFPVVQVTKELNIAALHKERDQLWAEALFIADFFEQLRFTPEAEIEMEDVQKQALDVEPGVIEIVDEMRAIGYGFLTNAALWDAIGLPYDKRAQRSNGGTKHQISQIEDLLASEGWEKTRNPKWVSGKMQRGYYKTSMDRMPEIVYQDGHLKHVSKQ